MGEGWLGSSCLRSFVTLPSILPLPSQRSLFEIKLFPGLLPKDTNIKFIFLLFHSMADGRHLAWVPSAGSLSLGPLYAFADFCFQPEGVGAHTGCSGSSREGKPSQYRQYVAVN